VPVMVKRKNAINEPLFTHPPETVDDLNPYARIIADEAMRRGIWVEVLDAEAGEMRLSHGGRSVVTRESLSEYTSAVAMSRCDDKRLTRRIVAEAGIVVARGRLATFDEEDYSFLDEVGDVVDELLALGVRKPIESGSNRERLPVLRRRIKPLMLRRTKAQVAPELPPKQEQVLTVDLGAKHHKIYDTRLARERGGVRPQRLRPSTGPTESARRAPSQSTDWCLRAQSRSGWWRYRSASVNCSLRSSAKARCWGQPSPRRISARFWGSTRTAANQRR
jgi:SNF2-related domain